VAFIGVLAFNLPKSGADFENPGITELNFIQENTLIGTSEHYYINPKDKTIELLYGIEIPYLLYKIIECESNFDPDAINQKYGSGSGIGLGQLTAVAIKDCENCIDGLCRSINPFNPIDNLKCSLWLYEKNGTAPWGCPDCWWGSYNCWKGLTE